MAIFYGGGHMPDMAKRLMADFQLKPVREEWVMAWDLHDPVKKLDVIKPAAKSAKSKVPAGK